MLGFFHGLAFLPVLLSLIGPKVKIFFCFLEIFKKKLKESHRKVSYENGIGWGKKKEK